MGQLQLSLYGTRVAAQNWAHEYTTFLLSLGFQVGRASPCNFTHRTRRIHLTVHGDDFTVVASAKQIAWLGEAMKKRYELKMEVLGPNAGQTEEVRVLDRIIRWTRTGLEYEPDQRHADGIISELELETCKSVSTLRVQESVSATRAMIVEGVEMDDKEARRFRALAARLNYLAGYRPDLLFASKCICKNMARLETSRPIPQRSDENGAAIPLDGRRHQTQTGQETVRT